MIEVARDTLARAGLGDRASFIRGRSQQVELPERVDVAICDHVGYFGFDYGIVGLFQDARRRFLKPGGALIPARIRLQIAAVESEKCRQLAEGWRRRRVPAEFHWLRDHSVNAKHAVDLKRDELISVPAELGTIDFLADDRGFLFLDGRFAHGAKRHGARAGRLVRLRTGRRRANDEFPARGRARSSARRCSFLSASRCR